MITIIRFSNQRGLLKITNFEFNDDSISVAVKTIHTRNNVWVLISTRETKTIPDLDRETTQVCANACIRSVLTLWSGYGTHLQSSAEICITAKRSVCQTHLLQCPPSTGRGVPRREALRKFHAIKCAVKQISANRTRIVYLSSHSIGLSRYFLRMAGQLKR